MTDLLPCPFCGSEIKHVERWTRSFVPPRLHHEWHHVADNKEICPVRRGIGKIVATATDDIEMQDDVICRWNNRVPALSRPHQATGDSPVTSQQSASPASGAVGGPSNG